VIIQAIADEGIASAETSDQASDSCWQEVGDQSGKHNRNEWWQKLGRSIERGGSMGGRSPSVIGEKTFCGDAKCGYTIQTQFEKTRRTFNSSPARKVPIVYPYLA
jgi:hypothetical protein